jgi:hypothetical protein
MDMIHNPSAGAAPSRFQPAAARWSALGFRTNWRPGMELHHQPSASEEDALRLSYGATD